MAQKTISQAIRENSRVELQPVRDLEIKSISSLSIESSSWYSKWWVWLIVLLIAGGIYWWFFY